MLSTSNTKVSTAQDTADPVGEPFLPVMESVRPIADPSGQNGLYAPRRVQSVLMLRRGGRGAVV
jgi:hypothetical protein